MYAISAIAGKMLLLGAGICLFAAFAHILLWASDKGSRRVNLLFGIISLVVTAMMLLSGMSAGGGGADRINMLYEALRAVLWALLVWLPALHPGARRLRVAVLLSFSFIAWGVLFCLLCAVDGSGVGGGTSSGMHWPESYGNELLYAWAVFQTAAIVLLLHHVFYLCNNVSDRLFLIAIVLFSVTSSHDLLLRLGIMPRLTLTEFGFLFFVLAMSRDLVYVFHSRISGGAVDRRRAIRLVVDSIPAQVSYVDTEQRVLFANAACRDAWGIVASHKIINKKLDKLLTREQYLQAEPYLRRAAEGERVCFEMETVSPKKEKMWLDVSCVPDYNESKRLCGFFVMLYDVTSHRLTEADAKRSEARFRKLVDACPMGIIRYEVRDEDLFIIGINPASCGMLRRSSDGIVGRKMEDAFPAIVETDLPERLNRVARLGESWSIKARFCDFDDFHGYYDIYAFQTTPGRMAVMFQDVTDQQRKKIELVRLAAAIQQAAEAVVITDRAGVIEYVNPAFCEITGYSEIEAIGKNTSILKSGEQDSAFYRNLWRELRSGKVWRGRFSNRRKDGRIYIEEAVISPVRGVDGAISNFVAVKQDITESIQMEEQLLQAQKMEAVGQLAGGIAHDFNNVLQAVEGYTELALMELPKDSEVTHYIAEVRKAADHAANLTRQLLAFSRQQVFQPRPLELNKIIDDLLRMLHRILGGNINIEVEHGEKLSLVTVDPGQVEQVVMNLCINARDAMPDGGTITIGSRHVDIDEAFCSANPWARVGSFVCLSVHDSGVGIEEDVQQRMFEPFYTTKSVGEGTGLGLSTVYAVVERHEGFLNVQSKPGEGSTFNAYFPVGRALESIEPEQKGDLGNISRDTRGTILLAEDDPVVRALAVRVLSQAGYTLHVAEDGQEAISLLDSVADELELAILDVIMPRRMGTEVMEEIRSRNLDLPILFSSGYGYSSLESGVGSAGVFLIRKPYSPDELLCKVHELIEHKI